MKDKLVPEWKRGLRYAYSIRLMVVAAIFSGLEMAWPFMEGIVPVSQGVFAGMSFFFTGTAFISRFYVQPTVSGGE